MEYQHLAFEEFARTVQPTIDNQPLNETAYHHDINPAVSAEFAHVVYRFGHSMLTDTLERRGRTTATHPTTCHCSTASSTRWRSPTTGT